MSRSRSMSVTIRPWTSARPAITEGAHGTGRTPRSRVTSWTSFAASPNHSDRASKVMIGSCTPGPLLPDLEHGDQVLQRVGGLGQLLRRGRHLLHRRRLLLGRRRGLLGPGRVVL